MEDFPKKEEIPKKEMITKNPPIRGEGVNANNKKKVKLSENHLEIMIFN